MLTAEQQYAEGWRQPALHAAALPHIGRARAAFPFDHRFRIAVAEYYSRIRWKGSRPEAIAAVRAALATDPFALDLHRNLAGLLYEDGDMAGSQREIAFLARYQPHWPVAIIVNANPATN